MMSMDKLDSKRNFVKPYNTFVGCRGRFQFAYKTFGYESYRGKEYHDAQHEEEYDVQEGPVETTEDDTLLTDVAYRPSQ